MRKVFIVEDDRFITAIFTMFLRDLGHELVGKTSSGRDAIEMCQDLKPDVILMDIHLEGELDGIQTAEMLKREIDIPVIYISSDTTTHVIERAIVSNSYGYLVKPINKKELGISIDLAYFKHKVDLEQKQREQGFREFISDSPLPIVVLTEGKISYLNRLGLDVFKTHYIEDVIGMPFQDFVYEKNRKDFNAIIEGGISHEKRMKPYVTKMIDVHGDMYWAEIIGSTTHFNSKQSIQLVLKNISGDQTNLKKIHLLEDIVFDDEKICILLDHELKVVRINASAQQWLGQEKIIENYFGNFVSGFLDNESDSSHLFELKSDEIEITSGELKKSFQIKIVKSFDPKHRQVFLFEKID